MSQFFCVSCGKPVGQAKFCPECGNRTQHSSPKSELLAAKAPEITRQTINGGKIVLIFLGLYIVTVIFVDVFAPPTAPKSTVQPKAKFVPAPMKKPEQIKVDDARLAKLKKDFVITTDEFNGVKTYRHRAFSKYLNGNGTAIEAEIREKDDHSAIYTESQFVSDDWIFHESYEVKAEGVIPMASEGETQREVLNGGGICEVVRSTPEVSVLIAAAIKAAQDEHKPVRIRLEGKFDHDYTLRPAFEKAIAETYELYSLIATGS